MKNNRRLKSLISLVIIVAAMVMPLTMNAQHTDGFFRSNGDNYENRDGGNSGLNLGDPQYQQDPTVPVGSGLLIMVAAGLGYTLLKKKED